MARIAVKNRAQYTKAAMGTDGFNHLLRLLPEEVFGKGAYRIADMQMEVHSWGEAGRALVR